MNKKGELTSVKNLFLKTKKGDITAKTLVALILVILFFAVIIYLFIQKLPIP